VTSLPIDSKTIRSVLFHDGYIVVPRVVPRERCEAVLEAIDTQLGIRIHDESTWSRVSALCDQVLLWGHQSQWNIRQLPELHAICFAVPQFGAVTALAVGAGEGSGWP